MYKEVFVRVDRSKRDFENPIQFQNNVLTFFYDLRHRCFVRTKSISKFCITVWEMANLLLRELIERVILGVDLVKTYAARIDLKKAKNPPSHFNCQTRPRIDNTGFSSPKNRPKTQWKNRGLKNDLGAKSVELFKIGHRHKSQDRTQADALKSC